MQKPRATSPGGLHPEIPAHSVRASKPLKVRATNVLFPLVIELRKRGLQAQQQVQFPGHYDGQLIGTLVPDLIVDELVIVDPKVVSAFNDNHMAQMLGYLNITNLELALLLNFKNAKLAWKRVVR